VKSTVLPVTSNYHELLDKIPQSAAIVQRGILKQINSSFVSLLGYAMDEVVEKNFFDFIALEGLADVEKYYLDRLKGENVTAYKTVFSTKDNNKISVEISIKQTIYNGEKAEIAIISCLDQQETQPMDDPALKK
jgi:PAS domain S-box-containing protein